MNPFKIPEDFLENMTQIFQIERSGQIVCSAHGFFCGNDYPNTIQLVENTDIKNGDFLIDTMTNQKYYALDARPIIIDHNPAEWLVKYQTEIQYKASLRNSQNTIFNIHSVQGNSVIGNQENVVLNIGASLTEVEGLIKSLPDSEKAIANELLDEMKKTESATHPVLVEGAFSKFSDLLKKHSDLLIAVGGWAVQLLIGK